MQIGQLAHQAGVPIDTVRYYERNGLLPTPSRRESGYRNYQDRDVSLIESCPGHGALGDCPILAALSGDEA